VVVTIIPQGRSVFLEGEVIMFPETLLLTCRTTGFMMHKTTSETVMYLKIIVTKSSIKDTDVPYFGTTVAQ
jgi:hypothetical protein